MQSQRRGNRKGTMLDILKALGFSPRGHYCEERGSRVGLILLSFLIPSSCGVPHPPVLFSILWPCRFRTDDALIRDKQGKTRPWAFFIFRPGFGFFLSRCCTWEIGQTFLVECQGGKQIPPLALSSLNTFFSPHIVLRRVRKQIQGGVISLFSHHLSLFLR